LVTVPTDACVTLSAERHEWSLRLNRGYCRQVTTQVLLEEIARLTVG
jgi:ureidoacrylate peracid hydrolase